MRNIYFFNTYLNGGAANAAINLFNNLADTKQFDMSFFYHKDFSEGKKLDSLPHKSDFKSKKPHLTRNGFNRFEYSIKYRYYKWLLSKHLANRPEGYEQFSFAKFYYKTPIQWFGNIPDIIHLHWIASWLDYESFFNSIPDTTPIIWTLHDMNPFTGGCHYSWECNQYKELGCKSCPQLNNYNKGKLAHINWKLKLKALKNKNIHIVGDSNWTTREAQNSVLLKHAKSFQTINYSIDFKIFKPRKNKQEILTRYKIPQNNFLIVLGAEGINNKRKGIYQLMTHLNTIFLNSEFQFLIFGEIEKDLRSEFSNLNLAFTGKIDSIELSSIYSAADIMIVPSLYEAFGLTAIEAMACGTPVIAFNIGGLSDSVINGKNGWLIEPENYEKIGRLLLKLKPQKETILHYREAALNSVKTKFSKNLEVAAYLDLYNLLI